MLSWCVYVHACVILTRRIYSLFTKNPVQHTLNMHADTHTHMQTVVILHTGQPQCENKQVGIQVTSENRAVKEIPHTEIF